MAGQLSFEKGGLCSTARRRPFSSLSPLDRTGQDGRAGFVCRRKLYLAQHHGRYFLLWNHRWLNPLLSRGLGKRVG